MEEEHGPADVVVLNNALDEISDLLVKYNFNVSDVLNVILGLSAKALLQVPEPEHMRLQLLDAIKSMRLQREEEDPVGIVLEGGNCDN